MKDLQDPRAMLLKAILLAVILIVAAGLLVLDPFRWEKILYAVLVAWSAARIYYFMFYVIERYIDPSFRFSGIFDCLLYLIRRSRPPGNR